MRWRFPVYLQVQDFMAVSSTIRVFVQAVIHVSISPVMKEHANNRTSGANTPDRGGAEAKLQTLSGTVDSVVYHNQDSDYYVLLIKSSDHQDLVSIVGHGSEISPAEWVTARGKWETDRKYGLRFRAHYLRKSTPTTLDGIKKYLGSGLVQGIGKTYAKRLVGKFGTQVFDIIENSPERLLEVEGIGRKRAELITSAWCTGKKVRDTMVFLHQHDIGASRATQILKKYGDDAIDLISSNPYRLTRDIRGIGFHTADNIAKQLGIAPDSMIRIRSGIGFALSEVLAEGHCAIPAPDLVALVQKLIGVPQDLISDALDMELAERRVIADTIRGIRCMFPELMYQAEKFIAMRLRIIARGSVPWPAIDADKALPWVERHTGLMLAKSQKEALSRMLASKVTVITGGPGVGKTTIVNSILAILRVKHVRIQLCAPTGRAAKRLSETTGMEAKTIHRLLEFDAFTLAFRRNENNPLDCGLLVVDEASMIDVMLMRSLLRAIRNRCALLIVGDVDQLPSVGSGQVLADIINSGIFPVMHLTEVFRQAARSRIITSAHQINAGQVPDLMHPDGLSDFYFVQASDARHAARRILTLVCKRIPQRFNLDPIRDIQVLCPMNKGDAGVQSLNAALQAVLNPGGPGRIERSGFTYMPGDKIMQTQNDYEKDVYNGDVGIVSRVDAQRKELDVNFDGRDIRYTFNELDTVVPAYAVTIHKSQGSEYPAVVIPLLMQHYIMLQRNLLYTGITRGKRLVVLVGQHEAVSTAVRTASARSRWSKLSEWLTTASDPDF